jgi:hypothetical protein
MKSRPRWGIPQRGQRYERIGRQLPGNSGLFGTDSSDAQTLEVVVGERAVLADARTQPMTTAWRAGFAERRARYRGGKTSESENPRALLA